MGEAALPEDPDARREAGRALSSARRVLQQLRWVLGGDTILIGIVLLIALSVDSTPAIVICSALFLAAVAGTIYVVRFPVPSTIALAVVHTPVALLAIGFGAGAGRIIIVGLAAVLWMCVPMALRTREIMRLYPDLWAARIMRGEKRDPGELGLKYRAQEKAHRKRRWMQILLFGVLPLALMIVGANLLKDGDSGTGAPRLATPTQPLLPTVLRFREAWLASKRDELKAFLADSERKRVSRLLDKSLWRKGWTEELPALSEPELIEYNASQYYAHFEIDGYGLLKTSWEWEDPAWVLVRIRFKKDD